MLTAISWAEHGRRDNRRLAIVDVEADDLTTRWGLEFDEDEDELGPVLWAAFRLPSGVVCSFAARPLGPSGVEFWGPHCFELIELADALEMESSRVQAVVRP